MLELAVLGLLSEGPLHGYELRKRLSFRFGAVADLGGDSGEATALLKQLCSNSHPK